MKTVVLLACVAVSCIGLNAGNFELISQPLARDVPSESADGDSFGVVLSSDGRYVLFASNAQNLIGLEQASALVPGAFPKLNAYLRDRQQGTTVLVSANLEGAGGNGDSVPCGISDDGRFALFESSASDLTLGDTNGVPDIFVRDVSVGTTALVSINTNGLSGRGVSRDPVITPDGRFVAFVSAAADLVLGDTNQIPDIFVRDLERGTTMLVSVGAIGARLRDASNEAPDITPDGRFIAFSSTATNLLPGLRMPGQIFVRDTIEQTTRWVSEDANSALHSATGQTNALCFNHAMSHDGQVVAFEASATNGTSGVILRYAAASGVTEVLHTNAAVLGTLLNDIRSLDITADGRYVAFVITTNTPNGPVTPVVVHDALNGSCSIVSIDTNGVLPIPQACRSPMISADGQHVVFLSNARGLVTNQLTSEYNLYARDIEKGISSLVNAHASGIGTVISPASSPRLSTNGLSVAFEGSDDPFAPNDRNGHLDVFVRDSAGTGSELVSQRLPSLPSLTPKGFSSLSQSCISDNGQYVAFASCASDLVPGDTNRCADIFVRDTVSGSNILVSVSIDGGVGNFQSGQPLISGDGRFVAFTSYADNLVEGDTNRSSDVFVRDLVREKTILGTINYTGTGPGNRDSSGLGLSGDGRYLLIKSSATNLVSAGHAMILLRDLQQGTNFVVVRTAFDEPRAAISQDGRYVLHSQSFGPKLRLWDHETDQSLFAVPDGRAPFAISLNSACIAFWSAIPPALKVVNWSTGASNRVFELPAGVPTQKSLALSQDGRFVVYGVSLAAYGKGQIFVCDNQTSTNILVSRSYLSQDGGNGVSDSAVISPDGRFVAFRSAASDLIPEDSNGVPDVFLFEIESRSLICVSRGLSVANNRSLAPAFASDSRTLFFESWASNLVPDDRNGGCDIFAVQLAPFSSGLVARLVMSTANGTTAPIIIWKSESGFAYSVEFKDSLASQEWQALHGEIIQSESQSQMMDTTANTLQRFYRVVAR